jgi:PAS domain S-box-containing protein
MTETVDHALSHRGGPEPNTIARLAVSEARLALAQQFGGAHLFEWDVRRGSISASAGFRHLVGLPTLQPLTVDALLACVHGEDRDRVAALKAELLRHGGDFECEYRVALADGAERWLLARGRVVIGDDGRPDNVAGVNLDITRRKLAELALARREAELAASEARFQAIVDSIDQMIWSTRPDGHHDFYNARWYEYTGVPVGSTDGEAWNGMFHPDDQARAWERWRRSLTTGEPYHIEYRLRHRSGDYRWVIGRAQAVRGETGAIVRWYGSCTDVHDLKTAEEAHELVSRELSHRIKNIFAVVASLVMLSAKIEPSARPFADALRTRIEALAAAHEHVRPHGPDSKPYDDSQTVRGLVETLLAPYRGHDDARVAVTGGDVRVGVAAATALALVFHELATNAVKYGALSRSEGRVEVVCEEDGDLYRIVWRERGGPPIAGAPARRGFGTAMSERAGTIQLGAAAQRLWDPQGLTFTLLAPRARLGA